jgi:ribosomal protein L12E/L44/L45/RPP1/RPP2
VENNVKKISVPETEDSVSELYSFFGRPPLLAGEDRKAYRRLQKAMSKLMQPRNALDALEVQEIVDASWEGRRLQKMMTKLVDAEHRNAFDDLADSSNGYISEANEEWLESIAGKPYPNGMTEADVLKKVGLNTDLLQARALLRAAKGVAVVDQLASNRVAARRASAKEYARRKRFEAKEKRLEAKTIEKRSETKRKLQADLANDNRMAESRRLKDSWV